MNLGGMQVVATSSQDRAKGRHRPGDTNIKQMTMGSWKASLSKGGQAIGLKGKVMADKPVKGKV